MNNRLQILLSFALVGHGCLLVVARVVACRRWTFNPIAPRRDV